MSKVRNNESAEMYLETILMLTEKKGNVRSIDVAHQTGYSKPSISRAMGLLKNGGFIEIDSLGYITLTESGKSSAQRILDRHFIITEFLTRIGVDAETATEDACRMEHVISDVSFEKLKCFVESEKK